MNDIRPLLRKHEFLEKNFGDGSAKSQKARWYQTHHERKMAQIKKSSRDNAAIKDHDESRIHERLMDKFRAKHIKKLPKEDTGILSGVTKHLAKHKETYGKAGLVAGGALAAGYTAKKYLGRKKK